MPGDTTHNDRHSNETENNQDHKWAAKIYEPNKDDGAQSPRETSGVGFRQTHATQL